MKKIICICICICICIFLSSGCDKSLNHVRPANDVVENTGSEAETPLPSNTSKASAPEPSNTPAPTPEPQPSSGTSDTGSSVKKYAVNIGLCVVALAVIVGGYKLLYRFADIESVSSRPKDKRWTRVKFSEVSDDGEYLRDGIRECFREYVSFYSPKYYFFDMETKEYIDEIPFMVGNDMFYYYYIPTSSKLKSLKIWLRKILRISTNYSALIKEI